MPRDDRIPVKNIYIMLAYAFQALRRTGYESVAAEPFESVQDLFAAILAKGVALQLKQGLHREYVSRRDDLWTLRGKLDMAATARNRVRCNRRLACEFDDFSENNLFNRILKTALLALRRNPGVQSSRKAALKNLLVFLQGIDVLDPADIPWNRLAFCRNNRNYELLVNVCRFALEGLLPTGGQGRHRMEVFTDANMARLYEKFILEYYRRHRPPSCTVKPAQVQWNLLGEQDEQATRFLPAMQTDVTIRFGGKTLIIDAKYYGRTLQTQFDKHTLHSANVYQIFSYVKNQDRANSGNVGGILLYAKTGEAATPDCMVNMGGNWIGAKTLDLNADFPSIAAQLDKLAADFFAPDARWPSSAELAFRVEENGPPGGRAFPKSELGG